MADEVEDPLRQAEEALREAVRKINAGMCPKCGRTDPHGDESHWTTGPIRPEYPQCSGGPDCQCPFHWGLERVHMVPLPIEEAALREHRRKIADGWHNGTCTGCGTEDEQVKGPPGAELCKWCDELRILAPAPAPPKPEPESSAYQDVARAVRHVLGVSLHVAGVSTALTIAGCMLILAGQIQIGIVVWMAGVGYQFRR
jgi:hypothetical protein